MENEKVDEKGLASRVEELEKHKKAAEHVDAIQARTIRELRAALLTEAHAEEKSNG